MYRVHQYKDGYDVYEAVNDATNSWFRIVPERGGIVFSFGIEGKELLYLDKETFYHPTANIRGGIPVLFPICGQLKDGAYEWEGKTYHMKNHGVARTHPWSVESAEATEGEAVVSVRLTSSESTLREFPFEFELLFEYVLHGKQLTILQTYANHSDVKMPMYAGFHPYFECAAKDLKYQTDATRYLDYNDMLEKEYIGHLDLTHMVESAVLLNAQTPGISFEVPETARTVHIEYGPEFKYTVLWSVEGKPFVCVEPWMAPTGSLNTGRHLVYVEPNDVLRTHLTITTL